MLNWRGDTGISTFTGNILWVQKEYKNLTKDSEHNKKVKAQHDSEMKKWDKKSKQSLYIYIWSKNKPKENEILIQEVVKELARRENAKVFHFLCSCPYYQFLFLKPLGFILGIDRVWRTQNY